MAVGVVTANITISLVTSMTLRCDDNDDDDDDEDSNNFNDGGSDDDGKDNDGGSDGDNGDCDDDNDGVDRPAETGANDDVVANMREADKKKDAKNGKHVSADQTADCSRGQTCLSGERRP